VVVLDLRRLVILDHRPAASRISSWLSGCSAAPVDQLTAHKAHKDLACRSGTEDGEGHGGS
jgi:hypothetical protein